MNKQAFLTPDPTGKYPIELIVQVNKAVEGNLAISQLSRKMERSDTDVAKRLLSETVSKSISEFWAKRSEGIRRQSAEDLALSSAQQAESAASLATVLARLPSSTAQIDELNKHGYFNTQLVKDAFRDAWLRAKGKPGLYDNVVWVSVTRHGKTGVFPVRYESIEELSDKLKHVGIELSQTATLGPNVTIGVFSSIGAYSVLMDNCSIGENVKVGFQGAVGDYSQVCDNCVIDGYVGHYCHLGEGQKVLRSKEVKDNKRLRPLTASVAQGDYFSWLVAQAVSRYGREGAIAFFAEIAPSVKEYGWADSIRAAWARHFQTKTNTQHAQD